MIVGKLKQSGELLVPGIDTRSPLITDGLVAHYPMDGTTHSTNTHFVAKAQNYPYETEDGIWDEYENTWLFNSGRSWHISVWDMYTNDWAVGINFQGASEITGPHARYDIYAVPAQITSFVNTINTLNSSNGRYMVAITGGHAAENNFKDSTVMKDAIKLCGGTTSKLSWTDRRTYICVGEVGCGEGNAQEEELGSTGDVTLRVPFFFYAKASTDTNTTITNDYVAIEEATTNLVSPITTAFSNWGGLTGSSVYYDTNSQRKGVKLITLNSGGVNWYNSGDQKVVSPSTVYTVSAKIKYIGGTPSPNLLYIRQYNSSGTQTSESGKYSASYQYYIGDGWYKAYGTFTTDSTATKALVQGYEYSGNRTIWIEDVQLEQKAFATEYVNGSRSASGKFTVLNPVKTGEFTISYDWKSNSPIGTASSYQTSFSMGSYYSNNSFTIMDTNSASTGGTQRLIRKGNAGEWAWIDANLTETASFQDWTTITIVRNATYYRAYSNGIYKGQIAHSSATMQDYIHVGSRESWRAGENSSIRNLSIYNRALSDSEVTKISKGTHSFTQDGLITKSINTTGEIRYIRDYLNGSTANTGNHWIEIKANTQDGTNVALGKIPTSNSTLTSGSVITDGNVNTSYSSSGAGLSYVQIDLGAMYLIDNIQVWHYYPDLRTYYNTRTQVSHDGTKWYDVFNSAVDGTYQESINGKTHYVGGSSSSAMSAKVSGLTMNGINSTATL